jgi:hypothetical protein
VFCFDDLLLTLNSHDAPQDDDDSAWLVYVSEMNKVSRQDSNCMR